MILPVDIVLNNHNYGAFVGEAIESALAQDHPAVNVIVVDDGSTDDSRERLAGFEESVELVLKPRGGQASAINEGFRRCGGEVVLFLDADDVLEPSAASSAARAFSAEPRAARVQFQVRTIDREGRVLGERLGARPRRLEGDLRAAELSFPFELPTVPTSANAFRTRLLRQIMPLPEAEDVGADYYLVHLTTLLGSVVALQEIGVGYRVHGGNAFQPPVATLSLTRIRREVHFQQLTLEALAELADRLEMERHDRLLSMSNLALRLVSLTLDPAGHPVAGDSRGLLLRDAVRAARRRYDVPPMTSAALLGLLAAIAVAPRPLAQRLCELLVFPELRRPSALLRPRPVAERLGAPSGEH